MREEGVNFPIRIVPLQVADLPFPCQHVIIWRAVFSVCNKYVIIIGSLLARSYSSSCYCWPEKIIHHTYSCIITRHVDPMFGQPYF